VDRRLSALVTCQRPPWLRHRVDSVDTPRRRQARAVSTDRQAGPGSPALRRDHTRGRQMRYRRRIARPTRDRDLTGGLPYDLVTGRSPDTAPLGREGRGGAGAIRHPVLRLRARHAGNDSAPSARVSSAVWLHASLRDEGEPEPGNPRRVPSPRAPRGRLQRLGSGASAPRRVRTRADPPHVPGALAPDRRARLPRRLPERLLPAPAGGIRPRRARTYGGCPHEPRTRQRLDEAHEHRWSLCELRYLARLRG
jgi:hypothetical protein